MRILIVGGGGLGTVYAGYLARAGVDVTLLVKPAHLARYEGQAVHISGLAEFSAPVRVVATTAGLGAVDYLVLCVKGRDSEAALVSVRGMAVEAALSFQNGVKKNEVLARHLGAERVLGATSVVGGTLLRPGHARHTLAMATNIGELDGRPSPRGERLAAAVRAAGLPAACVPDIVAREWDKLAGFLRTALVAAIARRDIASVLLDPDLAPLSARIVREVAAVAAAEGHPLLRVPDSLVGNPSLTEADLIADFARRAEAMRAQGPPTYPSMAQDVIADRPSELEDTAGDVLERAARDGVETPVLATCTYLLRAITRGTDSSAG